MVGSIGSGVHGARLCAQHPPQQAGDEDRFENFGAPLPGRTASGFTATFNHTRSRGQDVRASYELDWLIQGHLFGNSPASMQSDAKHPQVIRIRPAKRLVSHALALLALPLRLCNALRPVPAGRSKSVVILEPFGLGDVISHEPLARVLRESGWDVTLCARPEWRVLFPGLAWVNSDAPWGRHARAQKYVLREYFGPALRAFLQALWGAGRGSVGIDTRGDIRSVLLLHLAGCRRVITISSYAGSNLRMLPGAAERVEFSPELRRWEMNLRCAEPLGWIVRRVASPSFPHLRNPAAPARGVGLVPIAPWEGKWWQREKWSQLVAQLKTRGVEAVGLCGPGQGELARRELGGGTEVIECRSVEDWARRLQEFAAVVTLDSGPMHLADALGVPVMALFGQGSLPLWAPSGPASAVITHQGDPDFRLAMPTEENTASGREFMRRISVEEVMAALDRSVRRPAD